MTTKIVFFFLVLSCIYFDGILSDSTSDPCADVECASGKVCKLQHRTCEDDPCLPLAVCVQDERVKDGQCPSRKKRFSLRRCRRPCSHDFQCRGSKKCCDSGACGKVCTRPQD